MTETEKLIADLKNHRQAYAEGVMRIEHRDITAMSTVDVLDRTIECVEKGYLSEYADTQEEVKDLRRRITKLKDEIAKLEETVVSDTVACGRKGKKPIKTVKITGTPDTAITRKRISLGQGRHCCRKRKRSCWSSRHGRKDLPAWDTSAKTA